MDGFKTCVLAFFQTHIMNSSGAEDYRWRRHSARSATHCKGQEKTRREDISVVGEERFGAADESVRARLAAIADLDRLKRMHRRAVKAATWQEILDTP